MCMYRESLVSSIATSIRSTGVFLTPDAGLTRVSAKQSPSSIAEIAGDTVESMCPQSAFISQPGSDTYGRPLNAHAGAECRAFI